MLWSEVNIINKVIRLAMPRASGGGDLPYVVRKNLDFT